MLRAVLGIALIIACQFNVQAASAQADPEFQLWQMEKERLEEPNAHAFRDWLSPDQDKVDYERDRAQAQLSGVPIETVLKERLAAEKAAADAQEYFWNMEARAREAEAERRTLVFTGVAALLFAAACWLAFRHRRGIRRTVSRAWWGRSRAFRTWCFCGVFWGAGVFLFNWGAQDYDADWYRMDEESVRILGLMIVPPIFVGAFWFGYLRFVKANER